MGPKLKTQDAQPIELTRDRLVELMGEETADELLAAARGEDVPTITMTADEAERWCVDGPDDPFDKP